MRSLVGNVNSISIGIPPEPVAIQIRRDALIQTNKMGAIKDKKPNSFIVADTETIQIGSGKGGVHVPYAIGFLVVNYGSPQATPDSAFSVFYSEDHLPTYLPILQTFK